jgi:hypothetical protein
MFRLSNDTGVMDSLMCNCTSKLAQEPAPE